ncbi:PqqD family protein [Alteraurantiacibacter aquimixticola]|nr:PqqD family protein [Alteraurantiacibacter aquimixticola]
MPGKNGQAMKASDILTASEDAIAREVGGELVLMHLASGTYFGLNAVGARIWQLLEAGEQSLAGLCRTIVTEFDAPADVIEHDIAALAGDLEEHELVTRRAGS